MIMGFGIADDHGWWSWSSAGAVEKCALSLKRCGCVTTTARVVVVAPGDVWCAAACFSFFQFLVLLPPQQQQQPGGCFWNDCSSTAPCDHRTSALGLMQNMCVVGVPPL
ncbi:unnamed protein product [Sphagnum balticum]